MTAPDHQALWYEIRVDDEGDPVLFDVRDDVDRTHERFTHPWFVARFWAPSRPVAKELFETLTAQRIPPRERGKHVEGGTVLAPYIVTAKSAGDAVSHAESLARREWQRPARAREVRRVPSAWATAPKWVVEVLVVMHGSYDQHRDLGELLERILAGAARNVKLQIDADGCALVEPGRSEPLRATVGNPRDALAELLASLVAEPL